MPPSVSFVCRSLCAVLFLAAATAAHAQFETGLKLNKEMFLTYEGVNATVTVTNRSGSDVVMGGPNGTAWLSFEINDPQGRSMPPLNFRSEEEIVFKAGATISRKVALGENFSFGDAGVYGITANVYHPPTQQYYASNRARANFVEEKPFLEKVYGVPMGMPGAGEIRRYSLCLLRDSQHTQLYVRIVDDRSKLVLTTIALGVCLMVADPQVGLDRENRLHVLFMAAPHIYAHIGLNPEGSVYQRLYFKEIETNRPHLIVQADQSIGVDGGAPYDPTIPAETRPAGRSAKQHAPGL